MISEMYALSFMMSPTIAAWIAALTRMPPRSTSWNRNTFAAAKPV